jgi:mono/diheme cytochrome c family protein
MTDVKAQHLFVLAAGLAQAGAALALGGQQTTLGRQVMARPDAPAVATTTHARASYVLHCAGCHGVDGAGLPQSYVPGLKRLGDFLRLPGGREFVIKVPGVMGSGLDDAQVAEVANWVLSTIAKDSVPPQHTPYAAADVARARATPLVDVLAERRRLQEQARQQGLVIH